MLFRNAGFISWVRPANVQLLIVNPAKAEAKLGAVEISLAGGRSEVKRRSPDCPLKGRSGLKIRVLGWTEFSCAYSVA